MAKKKIFISCPMKGRTDENIQLSIRKMHLIAEILAGEELELIETFVEGANKDLPLVCLGESIKRMQDADCFIGVDDIYAWNGCRIERDVFELYKGSKNIFRVDGRTLMPDAYQIYATSEPVCTRAY